MANFPTSAPNLPTTRVAGGPDPAADMNAVNDEVNAIGTSAMVLKEAPLNVDHAPYSGNFTTAIAALPATGGALYIPKKSSARGPLPTITGKDHLTVFGDGSGSVLHNTTAGADAAKFVDCDNLTVHGLRVQGTSGTRDGIHLENCLNAVRVARIYCQGSGRHGVYAQRCFGIVVDQCVVGIDSTSPYPTGVANCLSGLVLTYDGSDVSSGCNQFVVVGGQYAVGRSQDWAIQVRYADGGTIIGPIAQSSKDGVKIEDSVQVVVHGYYGENNPTSLEYTTGTASVTNGSTTVTGSGTSWNTVDAEGVLVNAAAGKFLIIGTDWKRIASVQSNTSLTLESAWTGATQAGVAYRMQGVDLYLRNSRYCVINAGRGGGAILFENSPSNELARPVTESVFFDVNSQRNSGSVVTNRASAAANRLVDNGQRNRINQFKYAASGDPGEGRVDGWYRASTAPMTVGHDDIIQTLSAVYANAGTANQIAAYTDGKVYFHTSADTWLGRVQSGVVDLGKALRFTAIAAASVPNNTVFLDSADNIVKVKDNAGAVSPLIAPPAPSAKTTSYTPVLADANTLLTMDSTSAQVFTIPPNATTAFPIGTTLEFARFNTGTVTITPGSGVTIPNSIEAAGTSSRTITSRYTSAVATKIATNTWWLTGSLT